MIPVGFVDATRDITLTSIAYFAVSCLHVRNRAATVANDLNLYDVQSGEWTTAVVSPTPVGRFAHAACSGGRDKLLVFGGVNPGEDLADLMVLTAP